MSRGQLFRVRIDSTYRRAKQARELRDQGHQLSELAFSRLDCPVDQLLAELGREALRADPAGRRHLLALREQMLGELPFPWSHYHLYYALIILGVLLLLYWSTTPTSPIPPFLPQSPWVKGLGYVAMVLLVVLSQWLRVRIELVRKGQAEALPDTYARRLGADLLVALIGSTFLREKFPLDPREARELLDGQFAVRRVLELVERLNQVGALALVGGVRPGVLALTLLVNDARAQARGEVYLTADLLSGLISHEELGQIQGASPHAET